MLLQHRYMKYWMNDRNARWQRQPSNYRPYTLKDLEWANIARSEIDLLIKSHSILHEGYFKINLLTSLECHIPILEINILFLSTLEC